MHRLILVFLGGGLGSGARHLVSVWMLARFGLAFPWGTLTVNVVGSLLLGAVAQLGLSSNTQGADARHFPTNGLLGAFTYVLAAGDALVCLQHGRDTLKPLPAVVTSQERESIDWREAPVGCTCAVAGDRPQPIGTGDRALGDRRALDPAPEQLTLKLVFELLVQAEVALSFHRVAWEAFTAPPVADGLPAFHYYEAYRAAYAPAYRVVLLELPGSASSVPEVRPQAGPAAAGSAAPEVAARRNMEGHGVLVQRELELRTVGLMQWEGDEGE